MFEVKIDASDFERVTSRMSAAADQMPFALSRALNDAAKETYEHLIGDTWPSAVTVRKPDFLRWALHTKFSTKHDLTIEIYDNTPDARAHLKLHAEGGTKLPKGKQLAIPIKGNVTRGPQGVAVNQRPRNLIGKVVKGNLIFQAQGAGKHRKLVLMYSLKPSAKQPKDVPFQRDFETVMREATAREFPKRMMEAMRTRR